MKFSDFHPITLAVYFASIISFTMLTMNPLILLLSFLGAFFAVLLIAKRTDALMYLVVFLTIVITNPIFSHNGETVLFYLFEQRVTLEAFAYGMGAGLLILSVIYWFKLFSAVFTQDKLMWLVGKASPKLSIVLCMALRFIPLFKSNAKSIYNAQISLGVFDASKLRGKLSLMINVFSALISMSAENAIETADTMRSRGFGKGKCSAYSLVVFSKSNVLFILLLILTDILLGYLLYCGEGVFYYYPSIKFGAITTRTVVFYAVFVFISLFPVLYESLEELRWKYLISKI